MEPLEVLRDMIRDSGYDTVGGAPQVVKIYRHMNSEFFGVTWRAQIGSPAAATYGGRPLLDYEKAYFVMIDADAPTRHAKYWGSARPTAEPSLEEAVGVPQDDPGDGTTTPAS